MRRYTAPLLTVLMAIGVLGAASPAAAHDVTVTALAATCDGSQYQISYQVNSWTTFEGGANPRIDVLFNNVKVDQGSFPIQSTVPFFTGSKPAPAGGGLVTVTALVVGTWGNGHAGGQSDSATVQVPTEPCGTTSTGTGRFTGGGKQVDVGVAKVTRGLTIHCDRLLSNNLEINWGVGEHFHLTEHLTTIRCSDDPAIDQNPPKAPLDTLEGTGSGRYNNQPGYNIRFTLVDAGEPGRMDQMWFTITHAASGTTILDVPAGSYLIGGNLQAHYDQPHKK